MKVQPDIFSSGNKKKKIYRTTNSRIKYSSNGFRIYICTNKHHRWGVSSNIYRMFPSNHKRQHFKIKIFLHEQYSNLYLEKRTPLLRCLAKYIPNTFNGQSPRPVFRIYIWKRPPMLRVLRQIYTEYYHRNINVTSHGLRHWQRTTAPSLTNKST